MRDPSQAPERLHVVDPRGRIRGLPCHWRENEEGERVLDGVSHPCLDYHGHLTPEAEARGWALLRDLYLADERLGQPGFEVFADYAAARAAGRPGSLPEEWLPRGVHERRAGAQDPRPWEPPPLPKRSTKRKAAVGDDDA